MNHSLFKQRKELYFNFPVNENTEKRLPLLDLLLKASEDGKVLSNQDIRNEIDTFMFGVLFILFIIHRIRGFNKQPMGYRDTTQLLR